MSSITQQQEHHEASSSSIVEAPKGIFHGQQHEHGPAKRTRLMRIIGRSLLAVMVLVALAMIICWSLVFPKTPIFAVQSGNVTVESLNDKKLNATISFNIKSSNPNKRSTIQIDRMRMAVNCMGETFTTTIPTFSLTPRSKSELTPDVHVNFVNPFGRMREVKSNGFNLDLHFSATIRYVIERWISRRRVLEIYCDRLTLKINATTPFDDTKCTVDL